jgi:hypothetical protein
MTIVNVEERCVEGTLDDRTHHDRRGLNLINNVIIPILLAVMIGGSSSYIATRVTLSVVETKVEYLEQDLSKMTKIMSAVTDQSLVITKNQTIINGIEYALDIVEADVSTLKTDMKLRKTIVQDDRDLDYLHKKIKDLENQILLLQVQLEGK